MGTNQGSGDGKRTARRAVSMIFAFFLTLAFIALTAIMVLQLTVFRPSFLLEQMDESGYAEGIRLDLENALVSYGMSSGFDEAFFQDLLSEDEIRADIFLEAERIYDPSLNGVDVESFRERLYERMCAYAVEHGAEISPEIDEAIRYLTDICTEAYSDGIEIPLVTYLSPLLVKASKLVLPAIIALIIFIIVIAVFLIRIQRLKYRSWMYFIYALSASGIFFIALSLLALSTDRFERLGISGQGMYQLVLTYVTNIFDPMLWIGGGIVAISAICALIYTWYRKQRMKSL
jgi:hypothetical protein